MTISDPAREPMLDRAMPADAVPGSTIPEDSEAEIQLRDGTWVWAQVIGQRKDRQGRWCVGLRWYASPSVGGREGWYLLNRRYIRRQLIPLTRRRPNGLSDRRRRADGCVGYGPLAANFLALPTAFSLGLSSEISPASPFE